jgi:hypothetical protein
VLLTPLTLTDTPAMYEALMSTKSSAYATEAVYAKTDGQNVYGILVRLTAFLINHNPVKSETLEAAFAESIAPLVPVNPKSPKISTDTVMNLFRLFKIYLSVDFTSVK